MSRYPGFRFSNCCVLKNTTFITVLSYQWPLVNWCTHGNRSFDSRGLGEELTLLLLNNICVLPFEVPCSPRPHNRTSVIMYTLAHAAVSRLGFPHRHVAGQFEWTSRWGAGTLPSGASLLEARWQSCAHVGRYNSFVFFLFLNSLCLCPLCY